MSDETMTTKPMPPSIAFLKAGVRTPADITRWTDLILIDYWSSAINFELAVEMRKHCNIKLVCLKFDSAGRLSADVHKPTRIVEDRVQ